MQNPGSDAGVFVLGYLDWFGDITVGYLPRLHAAAKRASVSRYRTTMPIRP